jgi:N-acetylmuramoyl-L-alanine amidase
MAVITQSQTRRRRRPVRGFGFIIIIIVIAGAVLLAARPGAEGRAGLQNKPPESGDTTELALDAVQDKLEALDWVRQDLLPVNDYSRPGTALTEINAIVIHYVGNPGTTAKQNRSYYSKLADSHETSASSNFLIGMEGEILACVPLSEVAYCSNWRNDDTISIEYCHPDESGKYTEDTYASLVRLTAWLCNELGLDSGDVIRHYDVSKKECPLYFVQHEIAWESFRDDVQAALDTLQAPVKS